MRSTVWTGLFRGTATLGIGTILWLQQNYTPREKFEDYKHAHGLWAEQVIKGIDEKLELLREGQRSITQELRIMNRKPKDEEASVVVPHLK